MGTREYNICIIIWIFMTFLFSLILLYSAYIIMEFVYDYTEQIEYFCEFRT